MNRSCKLGFGKKFSSLMVRISCLLIAVVMTLLASGGSVWAVNVEGHDGGGSGGNSSNGSSSELPTCAPSCTLNIKFGTYGENGTFNSLLETSQTFSVEDISDFDEDAELDSYELYDNPDGTAYKITMNVEGSEVIIFGSQDDLNDYMAGRDSKAIGIDLTGLIDPDNLQNQFVVFGLVGGNGVAADLVVYDAEGNRVIKQTADIPLTGPENGAGYFAFLMNEDGEIIAAETQDTPDNEQTVTDDPVESSGDECFDGSGSLGWLLCPVIEAMSNVGKFLYGQIEENFLQIQAEDFFETGGGLAVAWGYIRNIANIFFIILFLVVIFSQLTGVGIDNYGIKKILPKLIVVAVLVNLSFLICEIAVDLSNIFGAGLKSMFAGLAVEVQDTVGIRMEGATMSGSLAAAGLGAGGAVLFALVSNPVGWGSAVLIGIGIGLAVLGIVITLLISLLFLFLILMIRNAGVVLLIAIAPVAIVCYALPNTEKLFKRWFSLFKSLLVVYPICGLLVGGGQLAGMILGSINNSSMKLAGMVVEVVPFFLIPKLLKQSLSLMGNVGATLSRAGKSIGSKGSSALQKGAQGSNAYKSLQARSQQIATRRRTGLKFDKDGNVLRDEDGRAIERGGKLGKFSRFFHGGKLGEAQARAQYVRDQNEKIKTDSLMGAGFDAALIAQQKGAEKEGVNDWVTLVNNKTRNGEDTDELYKMYDSYKADGNTAGMQAVARIAGRRKDTAADFLNNKVLGKDRNVSSYDEKALGAISKEIATGENSGMYKASAPLKFDFMSQINKNPGGAVKNFNEWAKADSGNGKSNATEALNKYVTKGSELTGIKRGELESINSLMYDENGNAKNDAISAETHARMRQLASDTIKNRDKLSDWDSTKAEELCKMSGGAYTYNKDTGEIIENATAGTTDAGSTDAGTTDAGSTGGGGAGAFNMGSLDNDSLLDMATAPGVSDEVAKAAEVEYLRREPDFNGRGVDIPHDNTGGSMKNEKSRQSGNRTPGGILLNNNSPQDPGKLVTGTEEAWRNRGKK